MPSTERQMPIPCAPAHDTLVGALLVALLMHLASAVGVRAQPDETTTAHERIAEAESLYAAGDLVDLAQLPSLYAVSDEEAVAVYRLSVLVHLQQDNLPQAYVAALRLLQQDPAYEPDPAADPPAFVDLVADLREVFASPDDSVKTCAPELSAAERSYRTGAFEEARRDLSECLNWKLPYLPEDEYGPALRLLSLLHLRTGNVAEAKTTAELLLHLQPDYAPDPVRDPPGYVAIVDLIKEHRQE